MQNQPIQFYSPPFIPKTKPRVMVEKQFSHTPVNHDHKADMIPLLTSCLTITPKRIVKRPKKIDLSKKLAPTCSAPSSIGRIATESYHRAKEACDRHFTGIDPFSIRPWALARELERINREYLQIVHQKLTSPDLKEHIETVHLTKEYKDRITDHYFQGIMLPSIFRRFPNLRGNLHFFTFRRVKNPYNKGGASLKSDIDSNFVINDREVRTPSARLALNSDIANLRNCLKEHQNVLTKKYDIDFELGPFTVSPLSKVLKKIKTDPESKKFYASLIDEMKTYPGANNQEIERQIFNGFTIPKSKKSCIQYFTEPLQKARLEILAKPRSNWSCSLKKPVRVLDLLNRYNDDLSPEEEVLRARTSLFSVLENLSTLTPCKKPDYTKLTESQFINLMENPRTKDLMISIFKEFGLLSDTKRSLSVTSSGKQKNDLLVHLLQTKNYAQACRLFSNYFLTDITRLITPAPSLKRRKSIILTALAHSSHSTALTSTVPISDPKLIRRRPTELLIPPRFIHTESSPPSPIERSFPLTKTTVTVPLTPIEESPAG
ncbi:MAG: hypothetical protein WC860_05335 [Candidatus Margulisiibacteriota bacterium]|jgi:hypothetical protein